MQQVNARGVRGQLNRLALCVAGVAALCLARAASADTLFDNFFYAGPDGNPSYNQNASGAKRSTSYSDTVDLGGYQFAEAFTSPITATVDSIILPLDADPFTYAQPDPTLLSATIVLYADNNGAPGTVLFSQVVTGLSNARYAGPNITGISVTGVTVYAGEQYWVGVNLSNVTSGRSTVQWFNSNTDHSSLFDDTYTARGYSWYGVRTDPNVTYQGPSPALFVGGTPIPLPASACGGTVLLCAMAIARLARRQSAGAAS
jgi:hypothetical protein